MLCEQCRMREASIVIDVYKRQKLLSLDTVDLLKAVQGRLGI